MKETYSTMDTVIDKSNEPATVLLVDDDPMVLSVTKHLLERSGHKVLKASGGEEALTLAVNNAKRLNVVLLDMVMPGMNGVDTFRRLKEVVPGIPILLCSGFDETGEAEALVGEEGAAGFVRKPFDRKTLEAHLHAALNAGGGG